MRLVSLEEFLVDTYGQKNGLDRLAYLVELSNQSKLKALKNSRLKSPKLSRVQLVDWKTPRVQRRTPKQFVSPHLQRRRTPRVRRKTSRYSPKQFVSPRRLQRLRTPKIQRSLLDRLSSKSTPIMFPSPTNIPTKIRYSPRAQKNWRSGGLSTVPVPIMGY